MESKANRFRYAYAVVASLLVVGILTQVFFIGLSLLGRRPSWGAHIGLGHTLSLLVILLIVFAYLGRLPHPFKRFTWLDAVLYVLLADIVIFMRDTVPRVAALHPVLAVLLFGVTSFLTLRAWRLVRLSADVGVSAQPVIEPAGD